MVWNFLAKILNHSSYPNISDKTTTTLLQSGHNSLDPYFIFAVEK
jgi:hypothetical protein